MVVAFVRRIEPERLRLEKTLVVGCYHDTDLPVISASAVQLHIPQLFH